MRLQVFPPPAPLGSVLMHILALEGDGGESRLPAAFIPSLILYVRGGVHIVAPDGTRERRGRFELSGVFMGPRHSVAEPGTVCLAVMFRPGLVRHALGVSADAMRETYLPMSQLADPAAVAQLLAAMDEDLPMEAYVQRFGQFLLASLTPRAASGIGGAFAAAADKLVLPMVDIATYFGLGERQLERRIRETFGVPLRDVRRIYRFGQALLRIVSTPPAERTLTAIAHDAGYFDQAHMHRDFRDMTGLSPAALLDAIASDDPAYWLYRIELADHRALFFPDT